MAYKRATQGGGSGDLGLTVATTGGTVINMPNWGVSVLSATSAEVLVMAPPTQGCRKTLVWSNTSSTVAGPVVKLCTNGAQSVTIAYGSTIQYTCIKKAATASTVQATVVELLGLSTNTWLMTNAFPVSTTPTAAIWGGAVTLTTT